MLGTFFLKAKTQNTRVNTTVHYVTQTYVRQITDIACISVREVDGLFGSVQSHLVLAVCVAVGCFASTFAPARPTASVVPPEP